MFRKNKYSTRRLLNLKDLDTSRLIGYNGNQLIYYSIVPYNLSVLSNENIEAKIFELMNLIRGSESVEILCLNNRENFRYNKDYLIRRIEEETMDSIKQLNELELQFIERIQIKTATARSFLIGIRIRKKDDEEVIHEINTLEKTFKQQGFTMQKLSPDELKTLLAVYFEQNVTSDTFEDIDGERWLKNEA